MNRIVIKCTGFVLLLLLATSAFSTYATTITVSAPSLISTTRSWEALDVTGVQRQMFNSAGLDWAFYTNGSWYGYSCSSNGATWTALTPIIQSPNGGVAEADTNGQLFALATLDANLDVLFREGTIRPGVCAINWITPFQTVYVAQAKAKANFPTLTLDANGYPWITYTTYMNQNKEPNPNYLYPYVTTNSLKNGRWKTRPGFPYKLSTTVAGGAGWWAFSEPYNNGDMRIFYSGAETENYDVYWSADTRSFSSQNIIPPYNNMQMEVRTAIIGSDGTTYYAYVAPNNQLVVTWETPGRSTWNWKAVASVGQDTHIQLLEDQSNNVYLYYADYPTEDTLYLQQVVVNGIVNPQTVLPLLYDPNLNHASSVNGLMAIQHFTSPTELLEYSHTVGSGEYELLSFSVTIQQ